VRGQREREREREKFGRGRGRETFAGVNALDPRCGFECFNRQRMTAILGGG
jgi:predicted TIM-barrel enzyme